MFFKPLKYEKYARKALKELQKSQNVFREKYDIDNFQNWFYNESSEILRLYSEDKSVYFKYILVGTFSLNLNTWMWYWANEYNLSPRKFKTIKIKELGKQKNYEKLVKDHFDGNQFTGWELTSIAFTLLGGIGTYRVVSNDLELYFIITEQITQEESEKIESELIQCDAHGMLRQAFICQHLNTESKVGFFEAFETHRGMELGIEDDFQSWCSECEKERVKTDGWNDESMEFAQIKLVCEMCYFNIKDLNQPTTKL